MSDLVQCFFQNQFCILLEYLPVSKNIFSVPTELANFPVCMTLADRVHSDQDIAPLQAAAVYPAHVDKVLHYAGKGRDIQDFERFLSDAKQAGYQNLLLLTGDKLKQHQFDQPNKTRYLESVNAVMSAKHKGGFHIGVAFNPFKYTEAEKDAQYFKLHKKFQAGADFVITQLGYDMYALQDVKKFLNQHQYSQKILACVMPLTLARARFMVKHQVAGIVITPHLLKVLEQEDQAGLTDQVYKRCALQILMCQHLGFAGVHLSACHHPKEQARLAAFIQAYQHLDFESCLSLWNHLWQVTTGHEFKPEVKLYVQTASTTQIIKYRQLHLLHDALFQSKAAKGLGKFIFKSKFWHNHKASKALLKTELMSKYSVVGCENCGQCRLAETLYICPETCPKGLANGPCGGTTLDRCEFGDRECIHSTKARLAKAVNQTDVLKNILIPTVPIEVRGTSSWKNWFIDASE